MPIVIRDFRFSSISKTAILFLLVLIAVVAYRFHVLNVFGFIYTDTDQSLMWLGTTDYAAGEFHEPRYYGQDYNSMLEPLLAVPLYWCGIPLYKALPVVTTLLTLFPFIVLAFLTFRKRSEVAGILILLIPLLLPLEYDLITSLPRGFVTGIAISTGCLAALFYPGSRKAFFLAGICCVLGYSLNANAVIVSIPCLLYLFVLNLKNRDFYLFCGAGMLTGAIMHFAAGSFYSSRPGYIVHTYTLTYELKYLLAGLSHLDAFFNPVIPVFRKMGYLVLPLFLLLAFLLYRKKEKAAALSLFIVPFLLIATLGISKVHDGGPSAFLSLSRMYLGIPVLFAIGISFLDFRPKYWQLVFLVLPALLTFRKTRDEKSGIDREILENNVLSILEVTRLTDECKNLDKLSKENGVDLIVISNHWHYDFYAYGCPACEEQFPKTLRPDLDRRAWRIRETENKVYGTIMVIDNQRMLDEEYPFVEKMENLQFGFLIHENKLPTRALMDSLEIPMRKY